MSSFFQCFFDFFFDGIPKKIDWMTYGSHHFVVSHYAAFSKTIFAFLRTPLLAIRFRNLLFVLPQQAANFLPNLFSFFILYYIENIIIVIKYINPNNNTAKPISSNHIFISNLHYDITIHDQIKTTVIKPTAHEIAKKSSISNLQLKNECGNDYPSCHKEHFTND